MARKIGITRDQVLDAAVALADTDGAEAVTLAAVAQRLGVRTPSLYAHLEGLADLRRGLALAAAAALATELSTATATLRGTDAIRAAAHAYRRFAARHPGLYDSAQLAADPSHDAQRAAALYDVIRPVLRALHETGIDQPEEQVHVTRAIRSALHGFVMLEQHGGFGLPEAVDESFRRLVELLIAGIATSLTTAHDQTAHDQRS